jgi:hypothetical protein
MGFFYCSFLNNYKSKMEVNSNIAQTKEANYKNLLTKIIDEFMH